MARLDPESFHDWQTGETMEAVEYKQERSMFIVANNDLDEKKLDKDGDFTGTYKGKDLSEYGDAFNNARLSDIEKMVNEMPRISATLKRGENMIDAPENVSLDIMEIVGDEIKNVADALDSGSWVLAPGYTVNAPNRVTLNATGGTNHVGYLIATVKPYHDYVYQVKNPGKIAVYNGAGTSAIVDYTEGQSIKFNSGANTSVRIYFRNKDNENGTFIFEDIMLFEGTTEREFVLGYQPVRGPYIEVENGSAIYFDEYLYKGDKLYQTPNGVWRKKQNKREVLLTLDNVKNPSISNHYTGGKAIKIPLLEVMGDADLLDQEVIKWNGMYFTRTDSAANQTNNRYYVDSDSLILFVSSTDTGWGDKPADPVTGPKPEELPNKQEIQAFIAGWKMAHTDGTTPYTDANKATKGDKKWLRLIGTGESLSLPTASYRDWKPFKVIYKTASEQDVPAKYEGALRLTKSPNKVTLGEGIVLREVVNPVSIPKIYRINDKGLQDSSLKNEVLKFLGMYKNSKKDELWVYYDKTAVPNANGDYIAQIADSLYDPVAIYTTSYKVKDRFRYSCYIKDTQVKGNVNFHMESDEQVIQIEELKRQVSQIELNVVDKLGKPYGIPVIGKDGFPLTPDGKPVGKLRYKRFYWELYVADNIQLYPAHVEASDKPNKYTKNIPIDGIIPKRINVFFSNMPNKPVTYQLERAAARRQSVTYGYTIDIEEWLTTGRVWMEDRATTENNIREYYIPFNKNTVPKDNYDATPPGHQHVQHYGTSLQLTKFHSLDPSFSNFFLEFTNTVGTATSSPSTLYVQVEVEVWGV